MSSLEQLLHDAMAEHTEGVRGPRPGAARDAVRHGSRVRRLQVTAVSGTAIAVVAVAGSVASNLEPRGATLVGPGAGASTTGTPASASPTAGASKAAAAVPPTTAAALPSSTVDPESAKAKSGVGAPADLAAVSLPDPAPGFPLRRSTDQGPEPTGVTGGTFWTQAFLVGKTPDRVIGRDADGRPNSFAPTGPEATVLVIDGAATTDGTVVGHTQVGGRPATFVHYEGENGLSFHAGRFVVQVWGFGGVTNDELVALAGALHGLPS